MYHYIPNLYWLFFIFYLIRLKIHPKFYNTQPESNFNPKTHTQKMIYTQTDTRYPCLTNYVNKPKILFINHFEFFLQINNFI